MENESVIVSERVRNSFRKLQKASASLNSYSDQLGVSILDLDGAIKVLNLGIESWVPFSSKTDTEDGFRTSDSIGYAKVRGKWGIAIKSFAGHGEPDDDIHEWLFNDAPRALRIQAIDYIPALLDQLADESTLTTEKVQRSLQAVQDLAKAFNEPISVNSLGNVDQLKANPKTNTEKSSKIRGLSELQDVTISQRAALALASAGTDQEALSKSVRLAMASAGTDQEALLEALRESVAFGDNSRVDVKQKIAEYLKK